NWHLVSFSRIGNLLSFAVDGNLISQFTGSNLALKNEELELGRSLWSNAMYFKGHIDEVRIYNRGLSTIEAKALYNQIK
ncbi:MAG: LamG-like jellyroll fold domain-containing protein, partial [Verrucomicrobiota bacterium]|nr:LamG-like jellyroll fold domain-containing protein [Verrucomicrobiota bacterium]